MSYEFKAIEERDGQPHVVFNHASGASLEIPVFRFIASQYPQRRDIDSRACADAVAAVIQGGYDTSPVRKFRVI